MRTMKKGMDAKGNMYNTNICFSRPHKTNIAVRLGVDQT